MSINATKWTFLVVVLCASFWPRSIPFPLLPKRLESTLLDEKDLLHILSVSRGKHLWETDLQNCLNHSAHFICVYTLIICVYTWDSLSRTTSGVCTSFLPKSTLESISHSPGCRVTRRIFSHRYATSRDETACASFHPGSKRIKVKSFLQIYFIGTNSCTKLWYCTEFSLSPAMSIHMNFASDTSALVILEQRFPVCMFGNTVFCMQ